MKAVRISFAMRTQMAIPPGAKHLDAVLSWAAVRKAEFEGDYDPWSKQHDIGLAKHVSGEDWCFMASILDFDWLGPKGNVSYIKRQRVEPYADAWMDGLLNARPAIDPTRGLTKAGAYNVPTRFASCVYGYAMVEDETLLNSVLPWVTHIGKLHHRDFGAVAGFQVIDCEEATQLWSRRNLPASSGLATMHASAFGSLRSPYWVAENHKEIQCFVG